jgi:hypothetical protein
MEASHKERRWARLVNSRGDVKVARGPVIKTTFPIELIHETE